MDHAHPVGVQQKQSLTSLVIVTYFYPVSSFSIQVALNLTYASMHHLVFTEHNHFTLVKIAESKY